MRCISPPRPRWLAPEYWLAGADAPTLGAGEGVGDGDGDGDGDMVRQCGGLAVSEDSCCLVVRSVGSGDTVRGRRGPGVLCLVTLGGHTRVGIGVGAEDGDICSLGGMWGTGRGMTLGLSCWKMSAKVARAWLVVVPKEVKGDAGIGFFSRCVRSFAVSITKSALDVAGMVTRCGKNSTVSLCLVPFVDGMYTW